MLSRVDINYRNVNFANVLRHGFPRLGVKFHDPNFWCPLYPRKLPHQPFAIEAVKGQQQTHAVQQTREI
jgi:hypothetical protein